ncbi:MAG: CoA transferase [Calditrichia bacterium]
MLSLVQRADVIIASYKPGDAEKLQMDYRNARCTAVNPKIIYAEITGKTRQPDRLRRHFTSCQRRLYCQAKMPDHLPPVKMPVALIDILAAHQLEKKDFAGTFATAANRKRAVRAASLLKSGIASLANQATN